MRRFSNKCGLVVLVALLVLTLPVTLALANSEPAAGGHGEAAVAEGGAHGEAAPAGGAHGEAAAEGGAHGPTSGQIWDFTARALNFAVLAVALFFVLRKPLAKGLRGRADSVREELAELEAKREEARRAYAVMEQRLKDAESEREAVLAEFRKQGEREREKIVEAANTLAERIKAQASFTIEQETAMAKAELRQEISEMSAAVAEELLKDKITAQDQTRLVDEYLAKVEQEVV
ncbi:MAG: F0F1 ATP synthase subunit B [Deltaproteobacteria bacterium]|nr:F0F1 ATP synthase subunit B [Deltaproteobacteria bacterium]